MKEELVSKPLSPTDLSCSVLKCGRIVLPRTTMELHAKRILELGSNESTNHNFHAQPQFSLNINVFLDENPSEIPRKCTLLLKKWTSSSTNRPIYVLENTSAAMKLLKATHGDILSLFGKENSLFLAITKSKSVRNASAVASTPLKVHAKRPRHARNQHSSDQEMTNASAVLLAIRNGSSLSHNIGRDDEHDCSHHGGHHHHQQQQQQGTGWISADEVDQQIQQREATAENRSGDMRAFAVQHVPSELSMHETGHVAREQQSPLTAAAPPPFSAGFSDSNKNKQAPLLPPAPLLQPSQQQHVPQHVGLYQHPNTAINWSAVQELLQRILPLGTASWNDVSSSSSLHVTDYNGDS